MTLHSNVRHCRKCIALSRQLTDGAAGRDNGTMNKILSNSNYSWKSKKMSMQNQSRILSHVKEYLSKFGYDKNLHLIVPKEWIEFLHRVTYSQMNTLRKLTPVVATKDSEIVKTDNLEKKADISIPENATAKMTVAQEEPITNIIPNQTQREQVPEESPTNVKPTVKAVESTYSIPQVLGALIFRLRSREKPISSASSPKWKLNIRRNDIPMHSIIARTRHVLNSIVTAESNASKWRRIEDLLLHIDQYPDARHYAIKEGGVGILLRARQRTRDEQIKASIREALAVLGYVDPLPGRGIRILSIDGGGIRGVLVIEMLKRLEMLTGKKTHEMFDYICGVSTGAILAGVLVLPKDSDGGGHKRKSLDEVLELYKELSTRVFTQSPLKGTSSLVWSHAYYDTALWEKLLQENLGDKILIKTVRDPNAPKFSAVSAVVNHARVMAYVFRNYTLPHRVESQYIGSHKHKLWEAVRASAAAPSYFEEYKNGEFLHQDGGILVNNPCAVAIHEAKQLWPNNPIQCVISFGTGRTPNRSCETEKEPVQIAISSWKDKFYKILDSATDTEAVHTMLNDLLPDNIYFRFNPYLTEMLSMVEIRPEKISQLEQDARMYIRRNEEKFQKAAHAISEKRKIQQKLGDWVALQRQMTGL